MKINKILIASLIALSLSVSGCASKENNEQNNYQANELREIYRLYIADGGYESYEDWLDSIKGENGQDGTMPEITIGPNGHYYINGKDTGVSAKGEKGDPGDPGIDGQKGVDAETPYETYLRLHPDYTGSEQDFYDELARGSIGADNYHTVTFETNGGTLIEPQLVLHGEKAYKPTNPLKEGYVFKYWSYEDEPWSFIGLPVISDITLVAIWE